MVTMSGGAIIDNVTGGNGIPGRSGGGVYIMSGGEFKKIGGVINGNRISDGDKGSQVFLAIGCNSRWRDEEIGESIRLDSGNGENWDRVVDW
jgi:hypothetical protein